MVREVTRLVRELKQWSEGDQEAPTTALKQWSEGDQEAPTTARGPASGGAGTGGRYHPL